MSDWLAGQIDNLETTAEIFYKLTSATEGGDSTQGDYKQFRASRLQLRFAQDLVTVIQFFLEKEKEHYARDHTATVRNGGLVRHFSELTDRSPESLAFSPAKQIAQDCRLLFDNLASVHQVACSKMGQLGVFKLYIKFDFPPDPHVARKMLSRICVENNALYYDISDSLNYEEPVKLPYEQDEAGLDICLARIRENTPKIINDVATGMDLWVEDV